MQDLAESLNHFEKLESYLPVSLLSAGNLASAFGIVMFFVVFRYFAMVFPFYAVFYWWKPAALQKRLIYPKLPGQKEQQFEIKMSLQTSLVFGIFGVLLGVIWELGYTQIYLKFSTFPLWYLPISWLLMVLVQDTYFYWTHRWLHQKGVYEKYHSVHHASLRPSPWASFSFHPVEAAINALIVPAMTLVIPVHPVVILFHLSFMTLSAITNHLGYEILPKSALSQGYGKWLISGLHHAQHHRYFNSNYGLFFSFWDRIKNTEHPGFEKEFARILGKGS